MKNNRRMRWMAAGAAAVCACHPFVSDPHLGKSRAEYGRETVRDAGGRAVEDTSGRNGQGAPDTAVYLSAAVFPPGYDWIRDTAYGAVPCSLVLLRNGVRTVEIPAGFAQGVSVDPDRHRIAGGHLYTDFSGGGETVIRRDGRELFRYAGEETLRGFLVRDGAVHTLGQHVSGRGFSYRIDGREVLAKPYGEIVGDLNDAAYEGGALYEDEGHVYFAWRDGMEYKIVCDGTSSSVPLPDNVTAVFDIRMVEGTLYRTVRTYEGKSAPLILAGGELRDPSQGAFAQWTPRICRIVPRGGDIFVKGTYTQGETVQYTLWNCEGIERQWDANTAIYDIYEDGGEIAYAASYRPTGELLLYDPDKQNREMFPVAYRILSNACAAFCGGGFYVALTGTGGHENLLWVNGERFPVPLNGFLTGVKVYEEGTDQSSQ